MNLIIPWFESWENWRCIIPTNNFFLGDLNMYIYQIEMIEPSSAINMNKPPYINVNALFEQGSYCY